MSENTNSHNEAGRRSGFHVDPRFTNLRPIGHGGSAIVYAATDSDCDKEVAIKKLSFCDRQGCKYALRELRLMRRLQHENVVTVYEVLGTNGYSLENGGNINLNINEVSSVYIVQELLHADLHQLIQQNQLTQEHVRLFTYQLLRGLKYIHSANVLHRDLKPMNLLINVEDLVLKIADFGLARVVDGDYSHKGFLTDNVGTCWYRSPELIISPRDYTKAIDLWSVGCILAEMLTGRPLFPGAHEMDQIGLILDTVHLSDNEWNKVTQILPRNFIQRHSRVPEKPLSQLITSVDIDALDLLEKLLVFEQSLRISAEEALNHPYLQQYSCFEDEPIVLTPFHIEHEVDDLSPKTTRKMISNEMSKSIQVCGAQTQRQPDNTSDLTPTSENIPKDKSIDVDDLEPLTVDITICGVDDIDDTNRAVRTRDKNTSKPTDNNTGMYIEDFDINIHDNNRNVDVNVSNDDDRSFNRGGLTVGAFSRFSTISNIHQALPLEEQLKNLQIVVDIPDEENLKEQISPKENKDEGSEKSKCSKEIENANLDRLVVTVDSIQPKVPLPKNKDIVNSERRAESPRGNTDFDEIDFIRLEKERMRQMGLAEKYKNGRKEKKKKKNRRNNRSNSGEDGQDFDTLYRLPTEHLTRHRHNSICGKDRSIRKVEDQLRLHEELNERRRLVEMEREHNYGAVGGYPDIEENVVAERSVTFEAGNISPTSEHSRDSSPTNEDVNVRRFDR